MSMFAPLMTKERVLAGVVVLVVAAVLMVLGEDLRRFAIGLVVGFVAGAFVVVLTGRQRGDQGRGGRAEA